MKNHILKFRTTLLEKKIIQNKAKNASVSMSEFIRKTALETELKNRLSKEEIECYQTLSKYADNFRRISNLFKSGDVSEMKKECLETSKIIRNHLQKLK